MEPEIRRRTRRKPTEATRLAAASAVLLGPRFRGRILSRIQDPHRAVAPEIGLDLGLVVRVAKAMERLSFPFELIIGISGAAFVAAAAAGRLPAAALCFAVACVAVFRRRWWERFQLAPLFERPFDPQRVARAFRTEIEPAEAEAILRTRGNVVVYRGFTPFVGTGFGLGTSSLAVELRGPDGAPVPLALDDVYAAFAKAAAGCSLGRVETRDALFVHGPDLARESRLLPDRFGRPVQTLAEEDLRSYRERPSARVRHYQWLQVEGWGSELVMSYFLRCTRVGDGLFVEISRFLLMPPSGRYRGIDRQPPRTWLGGFAWGFATALRVPFEMAQAAWALGARAVRRLRRATGLAERGRRREIETASRYNYGAGQSLRESLGEARMNHWFQQADRVMLQRSLDCRLLDGLADLLEARGIAAAEVRSQAARLSDEGAAPWARPPRAGWRWRVLPVA